MFCGRILGDSKQFEGALVFEPVTCAACILITKKQLPNFLDCVFDSKKSSDIPTLSFNKIKSIFLSYRSAWIEHLIA